ncbi:MAG: prepilin-type N-terminal cleavage/methylation domain-containing protein [Bacteriovorax sp.]
MAHFNLDNRLNHKKNNAGFTLVEVLIAILLMAFISLQTFRMVDNSTDTKENVLREDRVLLQSLTAVSRLDSDITQLYSPLYSYSKANPASDPNAVYQDNATSRGTFDGKAKNGMIIPQFQSEDKSTLIFLTQANRRKIADAKESRFTWVRYSLRRSEKTNDEPSDEKLPNAGDSELVRQTISSNIFVSDLNWSDVKAQVLMDQVKSVEFSFWDERAKKFTTSLQDLNENKNTVRSMKMDLVWVDENNHEQKIEKVYRILFPYFNTKMDDIKSGGAYGGSTPPPGVPDPNDVQGQGGGANVHY